MSKAGLGTEGRRHLGDGGWAVFRQTADFPAPGPQGTLAAGF